MNTQQVRRRSGVQRNLTVDDTRMLLWVLRDDLGLTGTKFGCGVVGILVESDFLPARTLMARTSGRSC